MSQGQRSRIGVVLANLGTPDAPTPTAVRRFLREFLSDPRVIEVPKPVWQIILNLFILPFRPRRVAELYAMVWQDGESPMRSILKQQCAQLQEQLEQVLPDAEVRVLPAMSYGKPALTDCLNRLMADGFEKIVLLPLFPQYSATSTAPVHDGAARWLLARRNLPALTLVKDYHQHPAYIAALAASVRAHQSVYGPAEKLLFSFHGIPQPYADKGDPYPLQCRDTAHAVAKLLGLDQNAWAFSFQSRFGAQPWVKPYTDVLLEDWAKAGVKSVQVICPAFSADCLETLEEIAVQNREGFLEAGGERYEYIPALNARADHIEMMLAIVEPHVRAHMQG